MNRCALALLSVLIVTAVVWQRANETTSNDAAKAAVQELVASYKQWRLACAKLAANRELKGKLPDKKLLPLPKFRDFERGLDAYMQIEREGPLADAKAWVGAQPDPKAFFDFENTWYGGKKVAFQPFAAKLVLPKDATVILMGDLHGDVRSLLCTLDELNDRKILDGFKFRDSKHYLLFLGDFTDRARMGPRFFTRSFVSSWPTRIESISLGATMRISTSSRDTGSLMNSEPNMARRPTLPRSCGVMT